MTGFAVLRGADFSSAFAFWYSTEAFFWALLLGMVGKNVYVQRRVLCAEERRRESDEF